MKGYLVCDWEDNGYHDSYFYVAVWMDGELKTLSDGATAYGGGGLDRSEYPPLYKADAGTQLAFKAWVVAASSRMIWEGQRLDCEEPNDAKHGDWLITTRECKKRGKPSVPAQTKGEVFWVGAFGTFYRNGYNKPNRENRSVGLRLLDGSRVFVPLKACRRVKEPEPIESIAARLVASYDAEEFNVAPLTPCKAWLSGSFIYPPAAKVQAA